MTQFLQKGDYEKAMFLAKPADGGMKQHVVKETFLQEAGRKDGYHGHGSGHLEVRETKVKEDRNTCTGEFLNKRKEGFLLRAD